MFEFSLLTSFFFFPLSLFWKHGERRKVRISEESFGDSCKLYETGACFDDTLCFSMLFALFSDVSPYSPCYCRVVCSLALSPSCMDTCGRYFSVWLNCCWSRNVKSTSIARHPYRWFKRSVPDASSFQKGGLHQRSLGSFYQSLLRLSLFNHAGVR